MVKKMCKKWTEEEDGYIRDNFTKMTNEEMSEFLDRTTSSIKTRRVTLKLKLSKKERSEKFSRIFSKHGQSKTRLYYVWHSMKNRCLNKNNSRFLYYGGRGVTICEEWLNFVVFNVWAINNGYKDGLEIDRIDNDSDYCPSNSRWVTRKTQMNNYGNNRILDAFGEKKTMSEWSEDSRCEVCYNTLCSRINRGKITHEKAITSPARKNQHA
jgi:hypothetical protein